MPLKSKSRKSKSRWAHPAGVGAVLLALLLSPGPVRAAAKTGGIIEQEGYLALSNVLLVDSSSHAPSRVRIEERDGRRVRVFARSGDAVPESGQ